MKVRIQHVEKSEGLVFKKKYHGIALKVDFSPSELAIIRERKLERTIITERGYPADVDAEKHANRGLGKMVLTAVVSGADANHFDLTIGKLVKGEDVYYLDTPFAAKEYETILREDLPKLKHYITENETAGESDTFEL